MDKKELARLIHDFKAGKATEREKRILEEYWQDAINDTHILDGMPSDGRERLKNEMFHAIQDRIGLERKEPVSIFRFRNLYKVAASLLILVAVSGLWYLWYKNVSPVVSEYYADANVEIQTKYGERRTVVLPDESSVVLNGNSKLRYSKNWSIDKPREVWIDGEGFFAVQHTSNHQKFIVHTREGLNVEVLGTKFNVKAREHGSEVLLTEGKVKLNVDDKSTSSVYLNPGELATMKKKTLSKRVVKDVEYTSWLKSKLVFDKMPLSELAQILHDTYGLDVTFQNAELKDRQLSGEISSATADDILFAIAETFNIKVTKMDDASVVFSTN
jgi:ferric-dicitrate binding protein FerR (iron transport regulator)